MFCLLMFYHISLERTWLFVYSSLMVSQGYSVNIQMELREHLIKSLREKGVPER